MRLVRLGPVGRERPAVVAPDGYVDVSDVIADVDGAFLEGGIGWLSDVVSERIARGQVDLRDGERVGAPIARPQQIIGIGLNYRDHALEAGMAIPTEPVVFNKAPNTIVGPFDDVHIPRGSTSTDWEVELGIVVGTRCRYLPDESAAGEAIAGYVLINDVSERTFQLDRGGQWVKGKSAQTFNPCGPWLVTPDEIPDVAELELRLAVNGRERQRGSTSSMVFTPTYLVHYLSQFMVLEPGDLINTGTPPGVGMGLRPPAFLRAGDVMDLSITHLGSQRSGVIDAP